MRGRGVRWLVVGLVSLAGCMIDPKEFDALRDQVKLHQKQIVDLKARQEEQDQRLDSLNNGFRILGDKADENGRRIDEMQERRGVSGELPAPPAARLAPLVPAAPEPPVVAAAPAPLPVPTPIPPAPIPAPAPAPAPPPAPAPVPAPEPILLTNRPTGAVAAVSAAPPAAAAPEGEFITAGPKAEKLYAGALDLFSKHNYEKATEVFGTFVETYPDHKLAGNAQYWIGECYYSQNRFKEAADEFAKVEKLYPASPKVPAALLKKGLSLQRLKRTQDAQEALERILSKYPQSEEATKARENLARWK